MAAHRIKQLNTLRPRQIQIESQSELTVEMFEEAKADFDAGRVITVQELAAKLRCGEDTARRLAHHDPAVVKKGIIRIPASAERRILRRVMAG